MSRVIRLLVRLAIVGWIVAFVASLVTAMRLKRKAPPPPDPAADEVELVAIFDRLDFRSTAQNLRGGRLDCFFGGGIVDLRDATLAPGGARIHLRTAFGGAQVLVPADWRVSWNVTPIMGGIGDSRDEIERGPDAPHLVFEGLALFGGVGINSEMDGMEPVVPVAPA